MFLRNAWYVAALARDVDRTPRRVTMLGEHIVLYRREDGSAIALEDACPHRKLPLSMGRVKGDDIECGYHGLTFDGSGTCVRVPAAERIPHRARVRSYPIVERYGFLWAFMGDPALADPAKIFRIEHWDDPTWGRTQPDGMQIDCNYLWITDNLLDPSHVSWVHRTSFGNADCEDVPVEARMTDDGVIVSRWMLDNEVAPFYAPFAKFTGRTDREQHYEVRFPSHAIIKAIFTPTGTGGPDGHIHPDSFLMDSYNFMTPVDATHTRYFWLQERNFAPGDAAVDAAFAASVRFAFTEDKAILEAVEIGMATKTTPNLNIAIDAGPNHFRQRLAKLIAEEATETRAAAE